MCIRARSDSEWEISVCWCVPSWGCEPRALENSVCPGDALDFIFQSLTVLRCWHHLIFFCLSRIFSFLDIVTLCRCAQISKVEYCLAASVNERDELGSNNITTKRLGRQNITCSQWMCPSHPTSSLTSTSQAWNILALDGSNWQRIDLFNFQTDVEVG